MFEGTRQLFRRLEAARRVMNTAAPRISCLVVGPSDADHPAGVHRQSNAAEYRYETETPDEGTIAGLIAAHGVIIVLGREQVEPPSLEEGHP